MPVRVIQTGLPGAVFDDSNASPFIPAVAQAGNTLLELGPKLASIRMQQAAMERQQSNQGRQFDLDQQRMGQEERRIGFEGDRLGIEKDRVGLDNRRVGAEIRTQSQKNLRDLLTMGAPPEPVAQSADAQEAGWGSDMVGPIAEQVQQSRALQVEGEQTKNRLNGAQADYLEQRPAIEEDKIQQRDEANARIVQEQTARREQALHAMAVNNVNRQLSDITSPIGQQFTALMKTDPAKATQYQRQLIEQQKAQLDPEYQARKQEQFLQMLQGMGPQ